MSLYTNKREILFETKKERSNSRVLHLSDLANDTSRSHNYSDSSVEDIVQRALRGEYGTQQKELESALLFQERGGSRKNRAALYNSARNVFVDTKAPSREPSLGRGGLSADPPGEARKRHVAISSASSDLDSEDAYKDQQYLERITKQLRAMQLVDPAEPKQKREPKDKPKKGRKVDEAALKRLITPNTSARAKVQEKYERRLEREKTEREAESKRKKSISPVATRAGKRLYDQARALKNDLDRRQKEEEENRKKNEEEFTFRPTISTYAQKLIDDDDYIPVEERGAVAAMQKENRERLRLEKEAGILRQHTFKPQISAGSRQILREQGYVSRSSNGLVDDPAQATERLYAEGGERLLRQQIRQRMEARKAAQHQVGHQKRVAKHDVDRMTERMTLWQQQREKHCDTLRKQVDERIQEQFQPEVWRKPRLGETRRGEGQHPSPRTSKAAVADAKTQPLRRTRSLPLPPPSRADGDAKDKKRSSGNAEIPIKEVSTNQNPSSAGRKAAHASAAAPAPEPNRLQRAASTGGLPTSGHHLYNVTASAPAPARSNSRTGASVQRTTAAPSDTLSPQPRTPYSYGGADPQSSRPDNNNNNNNSNSYYHNYGGGLPPRGSSSVENLPFEDQVESIVERELRSIRYGAFFYKYARGDTVTLKEVKEQARRYYPEDSQMVAALATQLGGSGQQAVTKSQFVEALLAYEMCHAPLAPPPPLAPQQAAAQVEEDEIDAALLHAANPRNTIYYVTEEMAEEKKADVSRVLSERRAYSRTSSKGTTARDTEAVAGSASGKKEKTAPSAPRKSRTKSASAPPEGHPRETRGGVPPAVLSSSTGPRPKAKDPSNNEYSFRPSLSARTIALSEIDRQKRENYQKERQLKKNELALLKSVALQDKEAKEKEQRELTRARGKTSTGRTKRTPSPPKQPRPRTTTATTTTTTATAARVLPAARDGASPSNVDLSSLSSSTEAQGTPVAAQQRHGVKSQAMGPTALPLPPRAAATTAAASRMDPNTSDRRLGESSGISSLEEINSELAEMDQLFDALYKKAEHRKWKSTGAAH